MRPFVGRLIITMIIVMPFMASAQWNGDPLQNTAIADTTGEQVVPKIAPASDGGCYISWYDQRNGNYSIYMQRLNALGETQWTANGLLISDHPQNSFVTDYDLTTDADDNAVVVFNDVRNGAGSDWDIFAYKIAPDGTFLWGPDGIGLSVTGNTDFEAAPKVTATSAGNFVVAWSKGGTRDVSVFQKISADGQKLWGVDGFTLQGASGVGITLPNVVAAENDSVIAFWESRTGNFPAFTIDLYTQKFAPDGSAAWDSAGVLIYDNGRISSFAEPLIYADGNGGAFYTYYDAPSFGTFDVWVQHVSSDGNLVYPINGVKASTDMTRLHSEPTLSYLPLTDELFVFWLEKNANQSQFGIYGQKISPQGNRLWTDEGRQFVEVGSKTISFVNSAASDTAIYVGYFESSAPFAFDAAVKAFHVDRNGNELWNDVVLSDASLGNKGRLRVMVNSRNQAFMAWKDERNDGGDIFAQNINPDSTLGNPSVSIADAAGVTPQSIQLEQNYPNPFNPVTNVEFEMRNTERVKLTIYDVVGRKVVTLMNEHRPAGSYRVKWDGRNQAGELVASGVYLYRLTAGGFGQTHKMILMR